VARLASVLSRIRPFGAFAAWGSAV
jgi:hypothetical protein